VAKGANHLFDASLLAVALAQPHWIGGGVNLLRGPVASNAKKAPPKASTKPVPQTVPRSNWMSR
jgi:hypothetical protein